MSQDICTSDMVCSLFALRELSVNRFPPLLALASALLSSVSFAQSNDVETVADPGADPRHPTATASHVEVEPNDDISAVVDEVPGVHSRRTSYGQTSHATVRGSNARQVYVEYEGLRLNPAFGSGYDLAGTGLGVDAITVWRGAAATYRGSGALAGALELRTLHSRKPGSRVEGSVLQGSHDTLAGEVTARVSTRAVSTRVGVGGRRSDGDFVFTDAQGVESRRVNNDHLRGAVFAASELREGDGWLRVAVLHDQGERGTPGVSEFQQQFAAARLDDAQTMVAVSTGAADLVRTGDWSVDAAVRAGAQRRTYVYSNPSPFLAGAPIMAETRSRSVSVGTDGTLWGPQSLGRAALDVRYDDWRSDVDAERVTSGLGTSWEQRFAERWTVVAALRGELDSDGRTALLPAVGAAFQPIESVTARANLGRTFRAPNLDELYLDLEAVRGNPDLVSERAWVADVGVEARGPVGGALTAFGRLVDDEILFLPVSAYLLEAQNIPGTYAAGAEAALTVDIRPVRGRAAYTFTHARTRETHTRVPLQPEHAADARVGYVPWDWFEVWTGGALRGSITLDSFGNTRDGAHASWDAGLTFGTDEARLRLVARNLLDDDSGVDALQQPIPGRTLWASLQLGWEQDP